MADIVLESFPFDAMEVLNQESSQMEPDREYEAKVFRTYFKMFLSNGVYYGDYKNYKENSMKVSSDGGMNISVAKGAGLIEGADFENTEERTIALERPASGSRVDRIVVQLNDSLDARQTKLIVKQGNGTTPASLQRDDNIYEICIAEVTVKSTSNITDDDIVDKRTNKDVCGIVNSLISVDGEELYQRFQAYIDSVSANLVRKDQDSSIDGKLTVVKGFEGPLVPKLLSTEDLNDIQETGFYYAYGGNTVKNKPSSVNNFALIVAKTGQSPYAQMLLDNAGNLYLRASSDTGWTDWNQFYNTKSTISADKLKSPRNIALSGAINGSAAFDGSKNITITTSIKAGTSTPSGGTNGDVYIQYF